MRTRTTVLNFITDTIPMLIIAAIGIVKINLFIRYLGVENQGAYQLFNQIFVYLALIDTGFGTAIMSKLYVPVKQNDTLKINELISGGRVIFNIIGIVIFGVGLILSFFLKVIIKDLTLDYTYLQISFLIYLLTMAMNFFYISYCIVYDVYQKRFKINIVIQFLTILKTLGEIVLILLGFNLIGITTLGFVINLIILFILRAMAKKEFPALNVYYKNKDYSSKSEIKNIIPSKLSSLMVNNVDIVVISAFLGLTEVAIYGVYKYITSTINNIIQKISTASLSPIGNLTVSDDKDDYTFFKELNSTLFFIASVLCIPLYFVLNPFISLWVGKNMLVSDVTSLFFVLTLYIAIVRIPPTSFITVYGLFRQSKPGAYIEATVNLGATLLGVYYIGIPGALLATIFAYIVSDIFRTYPLFKEKFKGKLPKYYLEYAKYLLLTLVGSGITYLGLRFLNVGLNNLLTWFIEGLAVFIINGMIMFGLFKLFVKEFNFEKRIISIFKK